MSLNTNTVNQSIEAGLYRKAVQVCYRIRPNYRTVRFGFSKLLGTLICGKICIYLLRIHYEKDQKKDLFDDDYVIVFDYFIKAYVVGTHLNCIDKSMQFK